MTRGLTLSVALHIVLVVFTIIGLPELFRPTPLEDRLMVVDVVTVGSITNAPPPAEAAEKPDAPKQTAKARPESPKTPPPPPSAAPPPPPPPTPKIDPPKVEAPQAAVPKSEPPKAQAARSAQVQPASQADRPAPAPAPKAPSAEAVPVPKPDAVAAAERVPLPKPKPEPAATAEAVPVPTAKPQEASKPAPEPAPEPAAVPLPTPKPEEAKKPEPEPEKPKPAEAAKPEAPKAEPSKPEPEAVKAAEASPAPPPPVPVSRPTPPKKPAKTQTAAKETPPAPEEKKKPEQADDFLNVLKTVQRMKQTASAPAETDKAAPQTTDSTARRSNFDADRPLSVSEMDAIRQQIARCWLVPAGAKEGESLAVEIRVRMNPDRTVREAEVVESGRMRSDPFFRAAAESALRALRNPTCTPLNLPPEKYETWKSFTITFDPRDMLS
ncbi:hypothetical protein GCM10017083_53830 [Thalassobaculum fulvum]|uniref:Cell division and transport-associated protein TolA n=1 Tax=Thalassobaculum fulvum TaxID=1633335 RepID=A0A918XY38_9PROT|nr:hypothetical protein [Thalassobaculum fulvum]GHD63491.1 hypothetical protein GCM10017083_53830 [Thalassobaculum fulvum]